MRARDYIHPRERGTPEPGGVTPASGGVTPEPGGRAPSGGGLVFGLIIVAVGVILLLDRFGVIQAEDLWRYWPLALVAIGAAKLAQEGGGGRMWGGVLLTVGIILSINAFGFVHVRLEDLWPLVIIGFGLSLLVRSLAPGTIPRGGCWRGAHRQETRAGAPTLKEWTIFGGGGRRITTQEFEYGEVLAIFGGWNLDMSKADIKGEEAVLEANCLFGGAEIRVPESWDVKMEVTALFGGHDDKTHHPRPTDVPAPKRLIIRGTVLFGGLAVKN